MANVKENPGLMAPAMADIIRNLPKGTFKSLGEFFTNVVVTFPGDEFTIENVISIEELAVLPDGRKSFRFTQSDGNVVEIPALYTMIQFQPLRS